jgi:hypothetical protein
MMMSCYAVPAAGLPARWGKFKLMSRRSLPQDNELEQGFRKNSGLLGANDRAESDKDCAQILCIYICTSGRGHVPIDVRRTCCFVV